MSGGKRRDSDSDLERFLLHTWSRIRSWRWKVPDLWVWPRRWKIDAVEDTLAFSSVDDPHVVNDPGRFTSPFPGSDSEEDRSGTSRDRLLYY